jgi:uncharacterized protein YdaT
MRIRANRRSYATTPKRKEMPKRTKVGRMYNAMVKDGMDKGKAARIAQSKTGESLITGRKPKGKTGK